MIILEIVERNRADLIQLSLIFSVSNGCDERYQDNNETFHDFGDPEFIAPEIINGELVATVTDMWSLGISVYVALTGISPLHGERYQANI